MSEYQWSSATGLSGMLFASKILCKSLGSLSEGRWASLTMTLVTRVSFLDDGLVRLWMDWVGKATPCVSTALTWTELLWSLVGMQLISI